MRTNDDNAKALARQHARHFSRIGEELLNVLIGEMIQVFAPDTPAEDAALVFALSAMTLTANVLAVSDKYFPAREALDLLDKMVADALAEETAD